MYHGASLADHRYVVTVLHLEVSAQGGASGTGGAGGVGEGGRGFKSPCWKLNNSILKSEDFVPNFEEFKKKN